MAGFGEPYDWTAERDQRMESDYPELADTSADDLLGVDTYTVNRGGSATKFSSNAMGLGAHSAAVQQEDTSIWGRVKSAGSSLLSNVINPILALDTPLSQRAGYVTPEGAGIAEQVAGFTRDELTRPSNIALAALGIFTGGLSTGGALTAGGSRIAARTTAAKIARSMGQNVLSGVSGQLAAKGVAEVAEYAPDEIGPLAGIASAAAGAYATRGRSLGVRGLATVGAGLGGYASPELAGGLAGGVLAYKGMNKLSSWKEAITDIESRTNALDDAVTQSASEVLKARVTAEADDAAEIARRAANVAEKPPISYRDLDASREMADDPSGYFGAESMTQRGILESDPYARFKTGGDGGLDATASRRVRKPRTAEQQAKRREKEWVTEPAERVNAFKELHVANGTLSPSFAEAAIGRDGVRTASRIRTKLGMLDISVKGRSALHEEAKTEARNWSRSAGETARNDAVKRGITDIAVLDSIQNEAQTAAYTPPTLQDAVNAVFTPSEYNAMHRVVDAANAANVFGLYDVPNANTVVKSMYAGERVYPSQVLSLRMLFGGYVPGETGRLGREVKVPFILREGYTPKELKKNELGTTKPSRKDEFGNIEGQSKEFFGNHPIYGLESRLKKAQKTNPAITAEQLAASEIEKIREAFAQAETTPAYQKAEATMKDWVGRGGGGWGKTVEESLDDIGMKAPYTRRELETAEKIRIEYRDLDASREMANDPAGYFGSESMAQRGIIEQNPDARFKTGGDGGPDAPTSPSASAYSEEPRMQLVSKFINSGDIPPVAELQAQIDAIDATLTRDKKYNIPTQSKSNISKQKEMGELRAKIRISNAVNRNGSDLIEAIVDLDNDRNLLSQEADLRRDPGLMRVLRDANYKQGKTRAGRASAATSGDTISKTFAMSNGESPHLIDGEVAALDKFLEDAVQEVVDTPTAPRVQPVAAPEVAPDAATAARARGEINLSGMAKAMSDNYYERVWENARTGKPVLDFGSKSPLDQQIVGVANDRGLIQSIDDVRRFAAMSATEASEFFNTARPAASPPGAVPSGAAAAVPDAAPAAAAERVAAAVEAPTATAPIVEPPTPRVETPAAVDWQPTGRAFEMRDRVYRTEYRDPATRSTDWFETPPTRVPVDSPSPASAGGGGTGGGTRPPAPAGGEPLSDAPGTQPALSADLAPAPTPPKPWYDHLFGDLLSIPRSLKSAFDLSAAGRQGLIPSLRHPGIAINSFAKQLKALRSEADYVTDLAKLENSSHAAARDIAGIDMSSVDNPMISGEKRIVQQTLDKIPGYRPSARAYNAYLNHLRDGLFETMLSKSGINYRSEAVLALPETQKTLREFGKLVNLSTGRLDVGEFLKSQSVKSATSNLPLLWAPQLLLSRVMLPFQVFSSNKQVRIEAAEQLLLFVGVNAALLTGVSMTGKASVELDPRSSDFGQIRVGATRIDPWAGYRPIANLVARIMSGQKKNVDTGELYDATSLKIVGDFLRTKLEPVSGTALSIASGQDIGGKKSELGFSTAVDLLAPLFLSEIFESYQIGGVQAAALTVPSVLGVGAGTYESYSEKMDRVGLKNMSITERVEVIPALAFRQLYAAASSRDKAVIGSHGSMTGYLEALKNQRIEDLVSGKGGTTRLPRAIAIAKAEADMQRLPANLYYAKLKTNLENNLIKESPAETRDYIKEQMDKRPLDRRFAPIQQQQRALAVVEDDEEE